MHSDLEHQGIGRWLGIASEHPRPSQHEAAPYAWEEFKRRSVQREVTRRRTQRWIAVTAAALIGIPAAILFWSHSSRIGSELTETSTKPSEATDATVAEQWLASLPSDPAVVRVGTRAAVSGLEDRIAQLDDILSAARIQGARPGRLDALQAERARLLKSLVQVRYAEELAR